MAITMAVLLVVSAVAITGAIWAFWMLADAIKFRVRGYRVRKVPRTDYIVWRPALTDWLYEEVTPQRTRRALRVLREPLAESGYPQPCRIYIPNADAWDDRAPSWARGRREELIARLENLFGPWTLFEDVDTIDGRICADTPPEIPQRVPSWWPFLPEILIVPLAIAAVGPWAATQLLAGRWLTGGLVLSVWLGGIVALAWLAVRWGYFRPGVAVASVLTVVGVALAGGLALMALIGPP